MSVTPLPISACKLLLACGFLLAVTPDRPVNAQGVKVAPALLTAVTPPGIARGASVTLTLDGARIGDATEAVFSDPTLRGSVSRGASVNQARVTLRATSATPPGIHRVFLRTPLGATGTVSFAVGAWPEIAPKEVPGTDTAQPVELPGTLIGRMDRVGDEDSFEFAARKGDQLVFEVVAAPIRSRFSSSLAVLDAAGAVVVEAVGSDTTPDSLLIFEAPDNGRYRLRVRDFENAAGGDVHYRINAGPLAYARAAFPLGLPATGGEVTLSGVNLPNGGRVRVSGRPGETVNLREIGGVPLLRPVSVALASEDDGIEHLEAAASQAGLPVPGVVNGTLGTPGEADSFRFRARKGESVLFEVQARRLGSRLDSLIEVLESDGSRIDRATLRCIAETVTVLNDRDSVTTGLRFLAWNDFRVNDFVFVRGEVLKISALPRGPDDDVRLRAIRGQRVGYLETTPSGHAINTPIYKVQIHPPGAQFPPNGMPIIRLPYQNDDGGPALGKDSMLTFVAPRDGEYRVRLRDVRGGGGPDHTYRLLARAPQPDFKLALATEQPNVPAGSRIPVDVTVDRLDGWNGPIDVWLEGLPQGITAPRTTIEEGEMTATLLISDDRPAGSPGLLRAGRLALKGASMIGGRRVERSFPVAGGTAAVSVLPTPDLSVVSAPTLVRIRPGAEEWVDVAIRRNGGYDARVPLDIRNLPFGVRILDVGLNGVLVTETETSRRFQIYCEPWVKPMKRMVYCTAKTESTPAVEVAAAPVVLEVLPSTAGGLK